MSDTTPPSPGFPPPLPPVPPAAPKKSRTNAIIIGSAATVIAAVVATGIIVGQSGDDDTRPAASGPSLYGSEGTAAAVTDPETATETAYAALTPADFTMELRTTKRQCFGSAGCNVTVEPTLSYVGAYKGIDPDAVYSITYEIRGDQSGPVIETAELSDETSLSYTPSLISTATASKKVSVKITDVVKQGA
ncbi:hypothetical protein ACIBAH_24775 [Streptomyces sp. NPDC051445]|uniref:hypothetical protein n=1 Tax=Streptomyces sp. NPDC051445 TaxID=3365653 RepID=UPI0037AC263A